MNCSIRPALPQEKQSYSFIIHYRQQKCYSISAGGRHQKAARRNFSSAPGGFPASYTF
ncbi:hypothetical protein SELSPUOL_02506 [Selenomonas sputigena ATCC 35185]|uniref:Uncharacterized protein n=1 Tax=Selenomonas sputigena (strain ATCC 35185 / DSM 20758 / CCUG 44933 / VPI D19B-28) TaxID=546271 RepID=C9LYE7_SELS3|nr:hypothetical protein SELSPUOL_02506 [Selenomonas sputigena ATCC 35185]